MTCEVCKNAECAGEQEFSIGVSHGRVAKIRVPTRLYIQDVDKIKKYVELLYFDAIEKENQE